MYSYYLTYLMPYAQVSCNPIWHRLDKPSHPSSPAPSIPSFHSQTSDCRNRPQNRRLPWLILRPLRQHQHHQHRHLSTTSSLSSLSASAGASRRPSSAKQPSITRRHRIGQSPTPTGPGYRGRSPKPSSPSSVCYGALDMRCRSYLI